MGLNLRRTPSRPKTTPLRELDLTTVLRDLYECECAVSIASLWERGWTVRIGDSQNGWAVERAFGAAEFDGIAPWLARTFSDRHPITRFADKYKWIAPYHAQKPDSAIAWYFSSSCY